MVTFQVLGDPTRFQIIELLRESERDAGQIAAEFAGSRPGISRHLRTLREHDFVSVRQDGQRRIYSLNPTPFKDIDAWLSRYRVFWNERLDALEGHIYRTRSSKGTKS
jgi:DNA-binding transcriptional ArsR family regulator